MSNNIKHSCGDAFSREFDSAFYSTNIAKMSNKLVLYNLDYSPPVRAVKVVARLLGLELELRLVN